jgi:hypothetical protein
MSRTIGSDLLLSVVPFCNSKMAFMSRLVTSVSLFFDFLGDSNSTNDWRAFF